MIVLQSNSVENIHRIQRKPPASGPALLDHQHLLRERGMGENHPIPSSEAEPYEPTGRSTQTLGPVEKKPYGGMADFSRDYPLQKMWEKDLGKKRKKDSPKHLTRDNPKLKKKYRQLKSKSALLKKSQNTADVAEVVSQSFANVIAILGDEQSDGSGFFISKNHIVTAAHVVFLTPDQDNNQEVINNVQVGVNIGGQIYQAYLVDFDVLRDFATIFIDSVNLGIVNNIRPINLGNSSNVRAGEQVMLFGNPIANSVDTPTMTQGIVSVGSDIAQRGMFVVDAEALEGMSGGMCYSLDRNAVVGIVSGYFSNNVEPEGGATTLTICAGIDAVKNSAKKKKIPFLYKESELKRLVIQSNNRGSTYRDDDIAHQQNESVGGTGGPGKGRHGKNPRKNFEMSVTQGPGKKTTHPMMTYPTLHGRELYMDTTRVQHSTPLDEADNDLKDHPRIKNLMDQIDESKGEWMFNIPISHHDYGKNSVVVYKVDNGYAAYLNDKKIAESMWSDEDDNPLLSLIQKVKSKYGFDTTYQKYVEDYGVGILQ